MPPETKTKSKSFTVDIHQPWCKGCYICVDVCPVEGIFFIEDDISERGFRPIDVKNMEKCTGCKLCELLCPDLAIEIH